MTPSRSQVLSLLLATTVGASASAQSAPNASAPETAVEAAPVSAPTVPDADPTELESVHADAMRTRRFLSNAVLIDGVVSAVAGGAMIIPDANDQAWRFAGINTAVFGVVNVLIGLRALWGIGAEERAWNTPGARAARHTPAGLLAARMHAAHDEQRESIGHSLNLGLDLAYAGIAGTAIIVSQSGIPHPDRWLASGIAIGIESVILIVIDASGMLRSRDNHHRIVQDFAPTVSFSSVGRESTASFGLTARF